MPTMTTTKSTPAKAADAKAADAKAADAKAADAKKAKKAQPSTREMLIEMRHLLAHLCQSNPTADTYAALARVDAALGIDEDQADEDEDQADEDQADEDK
jgi:hypothetical protein